MSIYEGSRLRVLLLFQDQAEDGTATPIDLGAAARVTLRVIRPDGTEVDAPDLVIDDAVAGRAHWDAAEGLLTPGLWKAQGIADGYRSAPVSWSVEANP